MDSMEWITAVKFDAFKLSAVQLWLTANKYIPFVIDCTSDDACNLTFASNPFGSGASGYRLPPELYNGDFVPVITTPPCAAPLNLIAFPFSGTIVVNAFCGSSPSNSKLHTFMISYLFITSIFLFHKKGFNPAAAGDEVALESGGSNTSSYLT